MIEENLIINTILECVKKHQGIHKYEILNIVRKHIWDNNFKIIYEQEIFEKYFKILENYGFIKETIDQKSKLSHYFSVRSGPLSRIEYVEFIESKEKFLNDHISYLKINNYKPFGSAYAFHGEETQFLEETEIPKKIDLKENWLESTSFKSDVNKYIYEEERRGGITDRKMDELIRWRKKPLYLRILYTFIITLVTISVILILFGIGTILIYILPFVAIVYFLFLLSTDKV